LAKTALGEPGESLRGQCDVVDDDRRTLEMQHVANAVDGIAGSEVERVGDPAIGLAAGERFELHVRILLRATLRHDVQKMEDLALAGVARDERSASLLADEDVLGDELVD